MASRVDRENEVEISNTGNFFRKVFRTRKKNYGAVAEIQHRSKELLFVLIREFIHVSVMMGIGDSSTGLKYNVIRGGGITKLCSLVF